MSHLIKQDAIALLDRFDPEMASLLHRRSGGNMRPLG